MRNLSAISSGGYLTGSLLDLVYDGYLTGEDLPDVCQPLIVASSGYFRDGTLTVAADGYLVVENLPDVCHPIVVAANGYFRESTVTIAADGYLEPVIPVPEKKVRKGFASPVGRRYNPWRDPFRLQHAKEDDELLVCIQAFLGMTWRG